MYRDNKEIGGRPHHDEILMIKILILAGWHGLSDYEVELLAIDRLSFRHFLGYPDKIPDRSTIWLFKERLASTGKIHLIWDELQRQLDEQGYSIKRGTMMHRSSPPIPVMLRQINPGVMPQRPGEAVMGHGLRKVRNRNSDTNFIRSSIRNTSSSDDSIRQLHRCMTVKSISRRREKRYTGTKDISEPFHSHQWTKP